MPPSVTAPAPVPWESLRGELLRFVRARGFDTAAADDIVHDVLLRALAELEGPEPPVHLHGWLYRVTRNAIVDHFRARRPTEELPEEIGASTGPEEESSAERELAHCLAPLLTTLSPDYREALTLAEVDGLAQTEIARRTGLTLSGVKSRVQRGRRKLREAVLDCCRVEVDRRGGIVDFRQRAGGRACESSGDEACKPRC